METETESSSNAFEIVNWRKNEFAKYQWDDDHDDMTIKLISLYADGGDWPEPTRRLHDWLALKINDIHNFEALHDQSDAFKPKTKLKWDRVRL